MEVDGLIYRETYNVGTFNFRVGPTVTITDAATGEVLFSKENFWQPEHISYDEKAGDTVTFNSPETGEPILTVDWSEFGLGDVGPLGNGESASIEKDGLQLTAELGDRGIDRVVITEIASGDVLFDVEDV